MEGDFISTGGMNLVEIDTGVAFKREVCKANKMGTKFNLDSSTPVPIPNRHFIAMNTKNNKTKVQGTLQQPIKLCVSMVPVVVESLASSGDSTNARMACTSGRLRYEGGELSGRPVTEKGTIRGTIATSTRRSRSNPDGASCIGQAKNWS